MRNKTRRLGVLLAVVLGGLISLPAQPAMASELYQDEAIQALQSSQVFVEDSVSIGDEDVVSNALQGTGIAVVALPPMAFDTFSASQVASNILRSTSYETILLAQQSGYPRIVVSSLTDAAAKTEIVGKALEANNDNLNKSLVQSVNEIKELTTASAGGSGPSGSKNNGSDGGSTIGGTLRVLGIVVVVSVWFFVFVGMFMDRKKKDNGKNAHEPIPNKIREDVPTDVQPHLRKLIEHANYYEGKTNTAIGADLREVIRNTQELFTRLKKKGTDTQVNMAEVEYSDKFKKLNDALGAEYYMDILEHGDLWPDAEKRIDSVNRAVKQVKFQIVENIRQVNASKDLEFQVVLDSLMGPAEGTKVEDIFNPDLKRKN